MYIKALVFKENVIKTEVAEIHISYWPISVQIIYKILYTRSTIIQFEKIVIISIYSYLLHIYSLSIGRLIERICLFETPLKCATVQK